MSKSKVPQIRFNGFDESWENFQVADFVVERNIQTPKSEKYPLMAFVANKGVSSKGDRYNREFLVTDEENKKYKQTELGDFIYSSNNLETGSIGLNKYGSATISPVYSIFQPLEIADYEFLGKAFIRKDFINKMIRWRQGVIYGQWKIHESDFINIEVIAPSKQEQTKIGKLLNELDSLIGHSQEKYQKLVKIKSSMLSKMFPKNGAKLPEIRFNGFSEHWELGKLKELAEFTKGRGYTKGDLIGTGSPIILYGRLYTKYETVIATVDTFVKQMVGSVFSRNGDVIVPASGETAEDISRASVIGLPGVILGGDINIIRLKEGIQSIFFALTISNGEVQKEMSKLAQGKSVVHLHNFDLEKIVFLYPLCNEQTKIGSIFLQIEKLLSLYSLKIDKLQNIKTALLEKMFV